RFHIARDDRPTGSTAAREGGGYGVLRGGGIARVRGLPGVTSEELVQFPGDVLGVAINLEPGEIGVMLLAESDGLTAGMEVRATGREADAPVGEELLGRVID